MVKELSGDRIGELTRIEKIKEIMLDLMRGYPDWKYFGIFEFYFGKEKGEEIIQILKNDELLDVVPSKKEGEKFMYRLTPLGINFTNSLVGLDYSKEISEYTKKISEYDEELSNYQKEVLKHTRETQKYNKKIDFFTAIIVIFTIALFILETTQLSVGSFIETFPLDIKFLILVSILLATLILIFPWCLKKRRVQSPSVSPMKILN